MSHLGILGMTNSGKSHYLKHELLPTWPCVVACDFNDELSQYGRVKEDRPLGPLQERCTASLLARHPHKLLEANLSLAVVPDRMGSVASEAACFDLVARLLIRVAMRRERPVNVKVVADECAHAFQALLRQTKPDAGGTSPAERLTMLATRGVTHLDIDLVCLTQRPNLLDATIRGNLDQVVYFKLPEALDIDTVRAKAGKPFAEQVRRLPPRKYLVWRATGQPETAPPPAETPKEPARGEVQGR